jgi:hypothetical protein
MYVFSVIVRSTVYQCVILILTLQLAALNVMDPTSDYFAPYEHQLEQQQISSYLPVQEQYLPAVTGSEQIFGPTETIPCHISNSYAYYDNVSYPHENHVHQQQATLPNPSIPCQIVPAVTSDSSNTSYSTGFSIGANSELAMSSDLLLPNSHPSHPSPLPPGPVTMAMPEHKEFHVPSSRVSNSFSSRKLQIIWKYGGTAI